MERRQLSNGKSTVQLPSKTGESFCSFRLLFSTNLEVNSSEAPGKLWKNESTSYLLVLSRHCVYLIWISLTLICRLKSVNQLIAWIGIHIYRNSNSNSYSDFSSALIYNSKNQHLHSALHFESIVQTILYALLKNSQMKQKTG